MTVVSFERSADLPQLLPASPAPFSGFPLGSTRSEFDSENATQNPDKLRRNMLPAVALVLLHAGIVCCAASSGSRSELGGSSGLDEGGLQSVLESAVSPAFGATIIIIVTVVVSASAYLCFLRYICTGCCKPTQIAPLAHADSNKAEEQV